MTMKERHLRSLIKGASWRVFGTLVTSGIIYAFTGNLGTALKVGIVEFFAKIAVFYIHERIWHKIPWGFYISSKSSNL